MFGVGTAVSMRGFHFSIPVIDLIEVITAKDYTYPIPGKAH